MNKLVITLCAVLLGASSAFAGRRELAGATCKRWQDCTKYDTQCSQGFCGGEKCSVFPECQDGQCVCVS